MFFSRSALQGLLKSVGISAQRFSSAEDSWDQASNIRQRGLIADIRMPGCLALSCKHS